MPAHRAGTSGNLAAQARVMGTEVVDAALARSHRPDPVLPGGGGPGGNARLTAWTGLILLVLCLAELVTLLDVTGWISWHVVIGVLLVPPALLKTASTGWRILRYYTGNPAYRRGGPPPMPLRLLGPLVIIFTLAVLGSGLALIAVGPQHSRSPMFTIAGIGGPTALMIHKATFAVWLAVTGVHTLARLLPALYLTMLRRPGTGAVPGRYQRFGTVLLSLAAAVVAAVLVLGASGPWRSPAIRHQYAHEPGHHHEGG